MVLGFGNKNDENSVEKAVAEGVFHYVGGHMAYSKEARTWIRFYEDRFEIDCYHLKIPYSNINKISNTNEMRRDSSRLVAGVILLPLALLYLIKKKYNYTIIEYFDGDFNQTIVIDLNNGVIRGAQKFIYDKMVEYRRSKVNPKSEQEVKKSEGSGQRTGSPIKF